MSPWLVLAVALVAYNLKFIGVPASSVYAGLVVLFALAWRAPLPLHRRDVAVLLVGHALFCGLSGMRWLADGPSAVVLRSMNLLVFGVPAGVAIAMVSRRSVSVVLRSVVYVTGLQSIAIVLTYVSSSARSVVARLLVQSGSISLLYAGRPSGFTNSSGSLLAVTQAFGACFGMVWLLSNRRSAVPAAMYWWVVIATVASVGSSVLSGRTSVVVLAIFLLARSLRHPRLLIGGLVLVGASMTALLVLPSLLSRTSSLYPQAVDSRRMVLDLLKLWRGQFFDVYRTMPYPRLGTNLVVGDPHYFDPGAVTHDAGVIQTMGSVGIPAMLLAYGPIAWFAWRQRTLRLVGWSTLCFTVLLLEFKEPFIFKGPNLALIVAVPLCTLPLTRRVGRSGVSDRAELVGPSPDDGGRLEVAGSLA